MYFLFAHYPHLYYFCKVIENGVKPYEKTLVKSIFKHEQQCHNAA